MSADNGEILDGAVGCDQSLQVDNTLDSGLLGECGILRPGLRDQLGLLHVATDGNAPGAVRRRWGDHPAVYSPGWRPDPQDRVAVSVSTDNGVEVLVEFVDYLGGSVQQIGGIDIAFMHWQLRKQIGAGLVREADDVDPHNL